MDEGTHARERLLVLVRDTFQERYETLCNSEQGLVRPRQIPAMRRIVQSLNHMFLSLAVTETKISKKYPF